MTKPGKNFIRSSVKISMMGIHPKIIDKIIEGSGSFQPSNPLKINKIKKLDFYHL